MSRDRATAIAIGTQTLVRFCRQPFGRADLTQTNGYKGGGGGGGMRTKIRGGIVRATLEQSRYVMRWVGGTKAKQISHVHLSMAMHVQRLAKAQAKVRGLGGGTHKALHTVRTHCLRGEERVISKWIEGSPKHSTSKNTGKTSPFTL